MPRFLSKTHTVNDRRKCQIAKNWRTKETNTLSKDCCYTMSQDKCCCFNLKHAQRALKLILMLSEKGKRKKKLKKEHTFLQLCWKRTKINKCGIEFREKRKCHLFLFHFKCMKFPVPTLNPNQLASVPWQLFKHIYMLFRDTRAEISRAKSLEGKGTQESWFIFEDHFLQAKTRCVPLS